MQNLLRVEQKEALWQHFGNLDGPRVEKIFAVCGWKMRGSEGIGGAVLLRRLRRLLIGLCDARRLRDPRRLRAAC